jgi:hypothetical protein
MASLALIRVVSFKLFFGRAEIAARIADKAFYE